MTHHDELQSVINEVIGSAEILLNESEGSLSDQQRGDVYALLADAEQFRTILQTVTPSDLPAWAGELSTLLMNIGGFSQLMLEYPEAYGNIFLNEWQQGRIKHISDSGKYLLQLVEQL